MYALHFVLHSLLSAFSIHSFCINLFLLLAVRPYLCLYFHCPQRIAESAKDGPPLQVRNTAVPVHLLKPAAPPPPPPSSAHKNWQYIRTYSLSQYRIIAGLAKECSLTPPPHTPVQREPPCSCRVGSRSRCSKHNCSIQRWRYKRKVGVRRPSARPAAFIERLWPALSNRFVLYSRSVNTHRTYFCICIFSSDFFWCVLCTPLHELACALCHGYVSSISWTACAQYNGQRVHIVAVTCAQYNG
jgi:hypothetical protein